MTDRDPPPEFAGRDDQERVGDSSATGGRSSADASRTDGDRCRCAQRLDADFDCRAPGDGCPRLRWLRRFAARQERDDLTDRARDEIDRLATALGLPGDVAETAVRLFGHARREGFLVGRTVEAVAAAAVYAAARQSGVPRTLAEVASTSQVSRRTVADRHRGLVRELDIGVEPVSPVDHLPRYADRLDLPPPTQRVARELLAAAEDRPLADGRNPASLVAAACYGAGLLTNHHLRQSAVGEATGVAEPTISDLYRELFEELSVFPDAE